MKTLNFFYKESTDLKELLEKNSILGNETILIQIFTSVCNEQFIKNLINKLNTFLPNAIIIGSTTDGEILGDSAYTSTTVLSFSIFYKTKIKLFSMKADQSVLTSFEMGEILAKKLITDKTKVIISFVDGIDTNAEEFLKGIESINTNITISGGLAGDNATFKGTFVFTNDYIYKHGVVGISLNSDELNVFTNYSFGWVPIGKKIVVTSVVRNRVYTINNLPTVDIYTKYLGKDLVNKLPAIGIEFPLLIKRGNYYLARAVLKVHSDKSITFAGNLKNGDSVYFGLGSVETIINKSKKLYKELYKLPIESIFIYSCMARRRFLQNLVSVELCPMNAIAPTVGFFTYGEFYHTKNSVNKLFNETMTILALSEDEKIDTSHNIKRVNIDDLTSSYLDTLKALTHLTNTMSMELIESNNKLKENTHLLISQSRQAAMGEMIGNIAHQWRQPLNILGLLIQRIQMTDENERKSNEFIDNIVEKGMNVIEKMSSTIDDFRNFFKPNKRKELFYVNNSIQSAINLMSAALKNHNIDLIFNEKASPKIDGFPNEFSQVILNIINNSKDAIIQNTQKNGEIIINITEDYSSVIIEIKDNGGGIKENVMEHIFEPYFTTKDEGKGTGIGLYMSKMIVNNMSGRILVFNSRVGVVFKIILPKV